MIRSDSSRTWFVTVENNNNLSIFHLEKDYNQDDESIYDMKKGNTIFTKKKIIDVACFPIFLEGSFLVLYDDNSIRMFYQKNGDHSEIEIGFKDIPPKLKTIKLFHYSSDVYVGLMSENMFSLFGFQSFPNFEVFPIRNIQKRNCLDFDFGKNPSIWLATKESLLLYRILETIPIFESKPKAGPILSFSANSIADRCCYTTKNKTITIIYSKSSAYSETVLNSPNDLDNSIISWKVFGNAFTIKINDTELDYNEIEPDKWEIKETL